VCECECVGVGVGVCVYITLPSSQITLTIVFPQSLIIISFRNPTPNYPIYTYIHCYFSTRKMNVINPSSQ